MKTLTGIVALVFVSTLLHAQAGLNGQWKGQTPNGMPITLDLIEKGQDLTGTIVVGEEKRPIDQGRISKGSVTFSVDRDGDVTGFSGEIMGDEIRLWLTERGPSSAVTLTRVEE